MAKNKNDFTGEDYRGKEDSDQIDDGFEDDEFEEESEEEARSRLNSLKLAGKIVLGLHIAAAVVLVIFAANSGFLPPKYVAALAGALAVTVLFVLPSHMGWEAVNRAGAIVLSLVFAIFMCFGVFYMVRLSSTLNTITSESAEQIDTVVVAVMANDEARTLADAAGYSFGVSMNDEEQTQKAVDFVTGEVGSTITVRKYDSPMDQANALLRGQVRAIIYNQAYTSTLDEGITEYSDKIRILFSFDLTSEAKQLAQKESSVDEPFTVYISGIDADGPITTTSRSDVNVLVTVNPHTHQVLLTSTPRDYYVPIPGITGEKRDKLTHAGIYGVETSIETLEKLYDIDIDYYVRVNFTSAVLIIDALGGVDVYVEAPFGNFRQGINHMDGYSALIFSRERYSYATGDNQRGRNQQAVIAGIIDKLTSTEILLHADELMDVMSYYMQTSMPRSDISKLVSRQLQNGGKWDIQMQSASGTGDSQTTYSMGDTPLYVMWPDEESVASASARIKELLAAR